MKFSVATTKPVPVVDCKAIVTQSPSRMVFAFNKKGEALKAEAVAVSTPVQRVSNTAENNVAVRAQVALASVLKLAEESRKAFKGPVVEYGRKIDVAHKDFVRQLLVEKERVDKLVDDYQFMQFEKQRAAQQAENERLSQLERDRAKAVLAAETPEEVEQVQEEFCELAKQVPLAPPPVRAQGQTVKEEWNYEVTDIWLLARAHPGCVNIKDRRSEVKSLLAAGVKVAGVRAWLGVKSGVRTAPITAIDLP